MKRAVFHPATSQESFPIPLAAKAELTAAIDDALLGDQRRRSDDTILKLVFNHFTCDAVVRDLPDLAFRVAEHLLNLDQNLDDVVSRRSNHHLDEACQAFGMGARLMAEDYPASSYHGPYLRMLDHQPSRGVDFIVRFINRACEAYAHPNNRYQYIESPGAVSIRMPDGTVVEQIANLRGHGHPHLTDSYVLRLRLQAGEL